MSNKYNLKTIGTYNPYKIGMKDEDFYDARHVRRELLGIYFDFKWIYHTVRRYLDWPYFRIVGKSNK